MNRTIVAAAALLTAAGMGRADSGRLEFADKPRMVNCEPASSLPCFRLKLNIVDAQGNPASPAMPDLQALKKSLKVQVDGRELQPFFAVATKNGQLAVIQSRMALILIDISGSMNAQLPNGQTRFDAAKSAALEFLNTFQNGTDHVAIVPFASRSVVETIRTASFAATLADAQRQVFQLPAPSPKNNTALFSAVGTAIDVLTAEMKKVPGSPEVMLLTMTDGTNDIQRGDDPGLLQGPDGLEVAARKVQASGIQAIGIGFGRRTEIDETALQRISTKHFMVEDPLQLKSIFNLARTLLVDRLQVTFTSPYEDRASLAAKSMHIKALLQLPSGERLVSPEAVWAAPQIGTPVYEGPCDAAEKKAILDQVTDTAPPTISILRPVLVFLGLGTVLLLLWFGLPRLIWPDRFAADFPSQQAARWAAPPAAGRSTMAERRAPPGFERGKPGEKERRPSDATIVQPKSGFTRTRLE